MENNIKNLNALLKPFNLEEALNGAPVVTRDGREVTDLHYFKDVKSVFKIAASVEGVLYLYEEYGISNVPIDGRHDLFMGKVEKPIAECWVNVYYWENRVFTSRSFSTKEEALANISNPDTHIRTVKIDNESVNLKKVLVDKPVIEQWVNIYSDDERLLVGCGVYNTEAEAIKNSDDIVGYIKTIKIDNQ